MNPEFMAERVRAMFLVQGPMAKLVLILLIKLRRGPRVQMGRFKSFNPPASSEAAGANY